MHTIHTSEWRRRPVPVAFKIHFPAFEFRRHRNSIPLPIGHCHVRRAQLRVTISLVEKVEELKKFRFRVQLILLQLCDRLCFRAREFGQVSCRAGSVRFFIFGDNCRMTLDTKKLQFSFRRSAKHLSTQRFGSLEQLHFSFFAEMRAMATLEHHRQVFVVWHLQHQRLAVRSYTATYFKTLRSQCVPLDFGRRNCTVFRTRFLDRVWGNPTNIISML